jgi:prepilin-type N-terminal cleavage/methylation domain-containing protein
VRKGHLRPPVVPTPWRTLSGDQRECTDGGFTLIELIIVTLIIPIIVGAITLALIAIFSLQSSTTGRLSGSGDAQLTSTNFETDVQNATEITTDSTGLSPQCAPASQVSGSTQVLGVQTGNAVISYEEVPQAGTSPQQYSLFRYSCPSGSTTPTSSSVVSSDVPSGQTVSVTCAATLETALAGGTSTLTVSPLPVTIQANDSVQLSNVGSSAQNYVALATANAGATLLTLTTATTAFATGSQVIDPSWTTAVAGVNPNCGASTGWISTSGVTGVTFGTTEPGSNPYTYKLVAVPRSSAPLNQATQVAQPNSSCVFASGEGYYTSNLCFVNFSLWNSYSGTSSPACTQGGLAMSAVIGTTGYTLSFCLIVTSVATATNAPVTGPIGTNAGYNGVEAVPFPTYPEAFLGNNGFYTVSNTVDPALYQQSSSVGKTTTVNVYDIAISGAAGAPVTGWQLVTGDAETTDSGESMTWVSSTGSPFSLLWNTPGVSAIGTSGDTGSFGACSNPTSPLGLTPQSLLTGGTALSVTCASSTSVTGNNPLGVPYTRNGTVMLEALTPTSLNVTLVGTGLEAMFMGILLPSAS